MRAAPLVLATALVAGGTACSGADDVSGDAPPSPGPAALLSQDPTAPPVPQDPTPPPARQETPPPPVPLPPSTLPPGEEFDPEHYEPEGDRDPALGPPATGPQPSPTPSF